MASEPRHLFQSVEDAFPLAGILPYRRTELDPMTAARLHTLLALAGAGQSLYFGLFVRAGDDRAKECFAALLMRFQHLRAVLFSSLDPEESAFEAQALAEIALLEGYSTIAQAEVNPHAKGLFEYLIFDHLEHLNAVKLEFRGHFNDRLLTLLSAGEQEGRPLEQQLLPPLDLVQGPLQEHVDATTWAHVVELKALERYSSGLHQQALQRASSGGGRELCEACAQSEEQHAMMLGSLFRSDLNEWARALVLEYSNLLICRRLALQEQNAPYRKRFFQLAAFAEEALSLCSEYGHSLGKLDPKVFTRSTHESVIPAQSSRAFFEAIKGIRSRKVEPRMTITLMPEEAKVTRRE